MNAPTTIENREIACLLAETADLMEIAGEDGFRIRSYRNAAGVIEGYPERIADIAADPEKEANRCAGNRQRDRRHHLRHFGARHLR